MNEIMEIDNLTKELVDAMPKEGIWYSVTMKAKKKGNDLIVHDLCMVDGIDIFDGGNEKTK